MNKIMAVVNESNVVINLIMGNENSPTESGTTLIEVKSDVFCDIGFTWDGVNFLNASGNPVFYEEQID